MLDIFLKEETFSDESKFHFTEQVIGSSIYFRGSKKIWCEIDGYRERAKQFSMPLQPELWGWGEVYKTTKSITEMAISTSRKTLSEAQLYGHDIDVVIICSSSLLSGTEAHLKFLSEFTYALHLERADIIGISLGRCTNLLKGIHVAQNMINASQARCILVVTSDAIENEYYRMENFALFSDGAASCLVCHTDDTSEGFTLVASAGRQDLRLLKDGLSTELVRAVNEILFSSVDVKLNDIDRLFHSNVYLPLCQLNELRAGYKQTQIYIDNISRFGHCFAADPLINFIDAIKEDKANNSALYQLAVSIPGARASLLLQKGGTQCPFLS